jgi:hypothetical protein
LIAKLAVSIQNGQNSKTTECINLSFKILKYLDFCKKVSLGIKLKDVREVTGISLGVNISGSMIVVFLKREGFETTKV